jgi:hypothetical protein
MVGTRFISRMKKITESENLRKKKKRTDIAA